MKTIRFTYYSEPHFCGYKCGEPGNNSGEYAPVDAAGHLLTALHLAADWIRRDHAAGLYSRDVRDARLELIRDTIRKAEGGG